MTDFPAFPQFLAERAKRVTLGDGVPAMLAHPDWDRPAPVVLWMHGRTASKELDPGRYLRWLRAGVAACAVDLPGHGERPGPRLHDPARTLDVMARMLGEIGGVTAALREAHGPIFDTQRLGIGGMSMGGMVALRALCEPHPPGMPWRCAAVEGCAGWLAGMYFPREHGLPTPPWPVDHPRERVRELDPCEHLDGMTPLPLLDLHSEADAMVPFEPQRRFIERLRAHYASRGADPGMVRLVTWERTGAPQEHIGFGRFSNDAKNLQTEFLTEHLKPG